LHGHRLGTAGGGRLCGARHPYSGRHLHYRPLPRPANDGLGLSGVLRYFPDHDRRHLSGGTAPVLRTNRRLESCPKTSAGSRLPHFGYPGATLSDLAKEHVGALMVIRGNDPLERHITGVMPLDGKLSGTLLKSSFDPHSPGHDGAVLVEQDSITRFAAHLPLSKNLTQLTNVGTRHSAALGLAELTDALCIVVSEERGTISFARDGKLREVENLQQLGAVIDSFLRAKFPSSRQSNLSLQFFRENWIAKAISLSLAIGFWYIFVPGSKTVQVSYRIPVSVENLPADLRVENIEPPMVNATFSGPRRAFYLFDARRIRVA